MIAARCMMWLRGPVLLCIVAIGALRAFPQNNAIFQGGSEGGEDLLCAAQAVVPLNNTVFLGGQAAGDNTVCLAQFQGPLNNDLFRGGNASGEHVLCLAQATSAFGNDIFMGGIASGGSLLCQAQAASASSNVIFMGGTAAGEHVSCWSQAHAPLNGSIFSGGEAAGEDHHCYLQTGINLNNLVFAGGKASGSTVSCVGTLVQIPLPVELLSFEAAVRDGAVHLTWSTATELNSAHFTVIRSRDVAEWEDVATVPAAGSSVVQLTYGAVDPAPYSGVSYYQLRQTDLDGSDRYSAIRSVVIHGMNDQVILYPNPAGDIIHISTTPGAAYTTSVVDARGRVVQFGTMCTEIPTRDLADGLCLVRIAFIGGETIAAKVLIQK